jgi:adenylate cyclase class 2
MKAAMETEVKIRVRDPSAASDQLRAAGFQVRTPRVFESNVLYDTSDRKLRGQGMMLRIRQTGGEGAILTWKGPGKQGPHKSRPEMETSVGDASVLDRVFQQLGFWQTLRYEKYRTEFDRPHQDGVVTLDETPIGCFLELEGPGDWIDATARELGFSSEEYILESYARLYVADCERRGLQPTHMTFAQAPDSVT